MKAECQKRATPLEQWSARPQRKAWSVSRGVRTAGFTLLAILGVVSPSQGQEKQADLSNQSLEDLMNVEVTSVSKTGQKLSRTASAVFVISQEDIRRSGATNIPDLLRMVPGMDVAQIDSNTWAITARGFNGRFSNELQVMVDGRSVYSQTIGGVFWDVLDLPLEDIERIEVIRGPGGSVWGANAVNGVINIITKKAGETKGGMVVAGGGNLDQGFGTLQYGGSLGKATDYRVYAKYFNQDNMPGPTGQDGGDGWHVLRGGFRIESALSSKNTVTVQGDLYGGREGVPATFLPSIIAPGPVDEEFNVPLGGGFLQGIWNHVSSSRSDTTLQISYDTYERDDALRESRSNYNVDFQHHFESGERQNFVWGLSYRNSNSHSDGTVAVYLDPANLDTQLFSAFIQDEITVIPDRLYLTAGAKLEHNYYTGFNLSPSVRAALMLNKRQTLWAATSRAVRSPDETDTSIRLNFGGYTSPEGTPVVFGLLGNPHVDDEGLLAYEAGYRAGISDRVSFELSAYYNAYSTQETTEPDGTFLVSTPAPPHILVAQIYKNLMYGESQGLEITAIWKATNRWTLSPGYAFEEIHMHLQPTSQDTESVGEAQGSSPDHAAQLHSHFEFSDALRWDASAYFVDRLTNPVIASYTRLDTGINWRWRAGASLSLVGQNLVKNAHLEFADSTGSARSTLIKRSVYAKFAWQF